MIIWYRWKRWDEGICYEMGKPPSHRWEGGVAFNLTNLHPGGFAEGVALWHISLIHKGPWLNQVWSKEILLRKSPGYLYQFVIMPNFVYLHDYQEYKSAFGKGFRRLCGMNGVKVHQMDLEDDHINIIIELPRWVHYKKFIKTLKSSCYKLIIREICPDSPCLKLKDFWSKLHAARWYSA